MKGNDNSNEQLSNELEKLRRQVVDQQEKDNLLLKEGKISDTIISSLPGVFYLFSDKGQFLRWNKRLEEVTGYSREEISKLQPLDFFDKENKSKIENAIQEVWTKGEAGFDADLLLKDGRKIPHFFTGSRVALGDGQALVGLGIDISERQQADTHIARLATLPQMNPNPVLEIDLSGRICFYNPATLNTLAHLQAAEDVEAFLPQDMAAILEEARERGGNQFKREVKIKDSFFEELISFPEGLNVARIYAWDITERKQAQEAQRESEAKYRILFESNPQPLLVVELESLAFLKVNQAATDLYGYSLKEFLSMTIKDIRPPEDVGPLLKRVEELKKLAPGLNYSGEWRHIKKSGEIINVEIISHEIVFNSRRALLVLVKDITERKRAEKRLTQNLREMTLLNQISHLVSSSISLANMVQATVNGIAEYLESDLVIFFLKDDGNLPLLAVGPQDSRYKLDSVPTHCVGNCLCGLAARDGQPIYAQDISTDPRCTMLECKEAGLRSFAALPLKSGDRVIGILGLASAASRDFKKQSPLLETLAAEISLALRNSLLLEEATKRAEELSQEVAERKRAEEALKASEAKYRQIVETANEGIWSFDRNSRTTFVNEIMANWLGYETGEIMGQPIKEFIFPDDLADYRRKAKEWREGRNQVFERRFRRQDGSELWAIVSVTALRDDQGEFNGSFAMITDITARKKAEEKIQQSQMRLQALFDGIPEPLIMVDRDMRLKLMNRAATSYYEIDRPEELMDTVCYQELKGLPAPCAGCEVPAAVAKGEFLLSERQGIRDPNRLEEVFVYPLPKGFGQEEAAIIRVSDVTEARLMERHLLQSEKLASLGLLVAGIAHEINNPNSFITFNIPILKTYLQELLPVADDYAQAHPEFTVCRMPYKEFRQDIFKLVDNLEHGSSRINATVSALRDFARERTRGEKTEFGLQTVIDRVVSICQGRIRKTAKNFTVEVPGWLPPMSSDPLALEQILVNLLINAAQALDKEESWITLKVVLGEAREDRFIIEVTDNGCGMDAATREKIFDPFFTTKPAGSGTGLGLSIVHRLVEELGGRIEVTSKPGQGTTFRLLFGEKD